MRKVTCMCEASFEAELGDEIDLDSNGAALGEILKGDFFAVTCPNCGTRLKPELRVRFFSKKKGLNFLVLPELERMSLYLGNASVPAGAEVLVGYAELFERAKVLSEGLDPEAIEIIKYLLLQKAWDQAPDAELGVAFAGKKDGKLVFHVSGLKAGELAVLPIAESIYAKTLSDKARTMREEPFDRIFKGPYRSLRALEASEDQ
jgi:hypothetical protein